MKNVKVVLTTLVFALAITGAVVAKTNEMKRFSTTQVFYRNAANTAWKSISSTDAPFAQKGGASQAQLIDDGGNPVDLFFTQDTQDPAKFVRP